MQNYIKHTIIENCSSNNTGNSLIILDDDSSDDELEEEMFFPRRHQVIVKVNRFVEFTVVSYSNKVFQSHFRMKRNIIYDLIGRFSQLTIYKKENKHGKDQVSAEKTFLFGVWYISNNETFRQTADRFDVSLSTGHQLLKQVANFLISISKEWIKMPSEREETVAAVHFKYKCGIDNVVGAIDGCHIKINKPHKEQDSYINRKGYHSLLLQGLAGYNGAFLDVYCCEPGSLHDARLLKKSQLYAKAQNEFLLKNSIVLGDSAYPNLDWLITPFKDNGRLTPNHRTFNYKLSSARVIVENAFGFLKGRFRRLYFLNNLDLMLATKLIMMACVLHNICIKGNDDTEFEPFIEDIPNEDFVQNYPEIPQKSTKREEIFEKMFLQL